VKRPLLVIETPRCGQFGHKFLVSRRDCQEQALAGLVGLAAKNSTGKHFISVASEVQQKSGAALRKGTERIIITGIDTARMGQEKIKEIQGRLNELKPALESLLKNNADLWQGPSLVVYLHELEKWMEKKEYADLPGADDFPPPIKIKTPWKPSVLTFLAILGVIVICVIVAKQFPEKKQKPVSSTPGEGQSVPVDKAIAEEIAVKWGLSEPGGSEKVQKLAKIIADKKSESENSVLKELRKKTKNGDLIFYFSNDKDSSELKDYLTRKSKMDVKNARDLKKTLADFSEKGNKIKRIWGDAKIEKRNEPFYKVLDFFEKFDCPKINDDIPVFQNDDKKVFDTIMRFFKAIQDKDYADCFNDQSRDDRTFDQYLQWAKDNKDTFKKKRQDFSDVVRSTEGLDATQKLVWQNTLEVFEDILTVFSSGK